MSTRIKCEVCGKSFDPSHYVRHECIKQPVSKMLTRKLQDKMAKKRRKGFMIDTNGAVFPERATESVEDRMLAIREMVKELNEIKLKRMPSIVAAVTSALNSHRARRKLYKKFGIAMN